MVNVKKRLFALFMTLVMALSISASAFAAEPIDVTQEPTTVASEEASTRAAGKVLAGGATTITGGSGSISVYLPSGNFWADLSAGIGYVSENGPVICSVVLPDGTHVSLGTIYGTGSFTDSYELLYASAGTYTFYFLSSITSDIEVVAYIYD